LGVKRPKSKAGGRSTKKRKKKSAGIKQKTEEGMSKQGRMQEGSERETRLDGKRVPASQKA